MYFRDLKAVIPIFLPRSRRSNCGGFGVALFGSEGSASKHCTRTMRSLRQSSWCYWSAVDCDGRASVLVAKGHWRKYRLQIWIYCSGLLDPCNGPICAVENGVSLFNKANKSRGWRLIQRAIKMWPFWRVWPQILPDTTYLEMLWRKAWGNVGLTL
jgi:hypothetical protein